MRTLNADHSRSANRKSGFTQSSDFSVQLLDKVRSVLPVSSARHDFPTPFRFCGGNVAFEHTAFCAVFLGKI
jgi:hypothetical protein